MRALIPIFVFLLAFFHSTAQIDSTNPNVAKAIKGAGQLLQSILGSDLYTKYIKVDYENSRESGTMIYTKDHKAPTYLRTDKVYEINFFLIKSKDTIAYFNFLVDTTGRLINYEYSANTFTTPELIVGYKRALTNDFKISLEKAIEIGKNSGFTGSPFLKAETDYKYTSLNKNTYIKVKYLWSYFEFTANAGTAMLDINAETGKIEKERYIPPMPK